MQILHFSTKILIVVLIVLITGCGGKEVLLKPEYSKKKFPADTSLTIPVQVAKVIDRRSSDPFVIGTAQVGMFNKKVPYKTSVPLADFLRTSFDTLFKPQRFESPVSAVAYIDSFAVGEKMTLFSEKGFISSIIRFGVPVSGDSVVFITTRFDETASSGMDVTDMLEPLVYRSVMESGKQFAAAVKKLDVQTPSGDSSVTSETMIAAAELSASPSQLIEAVDTTKRATEYSDLGFMYSQGDIVKTGVRVLYSMLSQKDGSRMMYGFGYNIEFFSIENTDALLKGNMLTYGGTFILRGFLSDARTAPFFGFNANLILGSETIDYGTSKESSFFVGPMLRETFGISFNKKLYLEAGVYQILLFGSKLLPDDIGFTAGLSFGI